MRARGSLLLLVMVAAFEHQARAGGSLGPPGAPITTSAYGIDVFTGPVLASGRPTGLAGAYAGLAEGIDGVPGNPAASAVRVPWSYNYFDYELDFGFTSPASLKKTDFDNNGTRGFAYNDFLFVTGGVNLQFGNFGVSLVVDSQSYRLGRIQVSPTENRLLEASLRRSHFGAAYAWFQGELVLGAGFRLASLHARASDSDGAFASQDELFSLSNGAGFEAGAVWAPAARPWRMTLAVRSPVGSTVDLESSKLRPDANGDLLVGNLYLPERVQLPWEGEVGVAYQIGPRPLNVPWTDPDPEAKALIEDIKRRQREREQRGESVPPAQRVEEDRQLRHAGGVIKAQRKAAYRKLPRQKLLLVASLFASGTGKQAVGVESFLQQRVDRSGRDVTYAPRFGVEAEPVANLVQVRAGSYVEPSRFRQGSARPHGTIGVDVRLFSWSVFGLFDDDAAWRVRTFADGARDYFAFGGSVGLWH